MSTATLRCLSRDVTVFLREIRSSADNLIETAQSPCFVNRTVTSEDRRCNNALGAYTRVSTLARIIARQASSRGCIYPPREGRHGDEECTGGWWMLNVS